MHRAFRKALCRVGLFTLVLGGGALALPSLAAANPACGKVVTTNVTLTANMTCTSGNTLTTGAPDGHGGSALYAGANHITINLNGFNILSDGSALYAGANHITINLNGFNILSDGSVSRGVDNTGNWPAGAPGAGGTAGPGTGFNNVTVTNGIVRDFGHVGIYVENAVNMSISSVSSYGNGNVGAEIQATNKTSISRSHFGKASDRNGNDGVDMSDNLAMTVTRSFFNWNGSEGLDDEYSTGATLDHVTAHNNYDDGVFVYAPGAPYLVENSTAFGNGGSGFETEANHFGQITFNNNTSENNGGWGMFAQVFADGSNNGVEDNASGPCHNVGGCHTNP